MSEEASSASGAARRSSRRSSASSEPRRPPGHPHRSPVDARRIDSAQIRAALDDRGAWTTEFLGRLDFGEVEDRDLELLFPTQVRRARERDNGELLLPPEHLRRTSDQIKTWFGYGARQKRNIIAEAEEYDWQIQYCHHPVVIYERERGWFEPPEEEEPVPPPEPRKCTGITLEHIEAMEMRGDNVAERRAKRVLGFKHLVRQGFTTRSALSQPDDDKWKPYVPPIVGAVLDGNKAGKVCYVIEEHQRQVGEDQFYFHNIHAVECARELVAPGKDLCGCCQKRKEVLIRQCEAAVDARENEHNPNTRNSLTHRSGTLERARTDYHRRESRNKSKKITRRDKALAKLTQQTAIKVPMNPHLDEIFNPKVDAAVQAFLDAQVSKDSVAKYVWTKSMEKHKIALELGATAVEHCPLTIRLGATIREGMGYKGGLYDLVAKICGLPSDRQLRRYKVANSNAKDGFMIDNVRMAQQQYDAKNGDAGMFDFSRHGSMAFDSMHTKGRLEVNHHTNQLVGVAENAFEEKVIVNECQQLEKTRETDDVDKMAIPEIAKHFLVFIFTTWKAGVKYQFLVARYALKSISYQFLVRTIPKLANLLVLYGWIVDTVAGDGAPENRAAFKILCTISAREVLDGVWDEDELKGLPLNFKIGFEHPHPIFRKKVTIVIGAEMPHWGKKFRNAFDNESRDLHFRGKKMSLEMIRDIWLASGDADTTVGLVRRYNKTRDHFNLNSYLKMRVFLALQIPSQNTIQMIRDFCSAESYEDGFEDVPDIAEYQPMIDIFEQVDRLVDIMNGTAYKRAKNKDVELINTPKHRHISELFDVLRLFEEWKAEHKGKGKKGQASKYLTSYTHEDLCWMVFGVAAVARLYLKADGSVAMHQGRSGSDVCEHFFSMIRYINQNPTMKQCIDGASRVSSRGMLGKGNLFSFDSRANAGKAHLEAEDYLRELPKPKKRKTSK